MTFKRFVQIGRIVLINYGSDAGKLATIIDILDENKCLIDGPYELTQVRRQIIPFKRIALTNLTVNIPRQPRIGTLRKALEKQEILKKWENTSWAKKLQAKKIRKSLNDFDRFKLMIARKKRCRIVRTKFNELKKIDTPKVN